MRRVCEYIMRHLPQWREFLKHRHAECTARTQARLTRLEEIVRYKNSVAGKLEHLKEMEKRWTRRQRLAETRLKNIRRKIKRLERRQQTGPEACPTGNACV
jgi:chromosome segregation ATPase